MESHPGDENRAIAADRTGAEAGRALADPARWPRKLADLGNRIRESSWADEAAFGQAWQILNATISRYIGFHMGRIALVSADDISDIAAEKSLEILRRVESGMWTLHEQSDADIRGYLSKVARNGLVDTVRRRCRYEALTGDDPPDAGLDDGAAPMDRHLQTGTDQPAAETHRREFVAAVVRCAGKLAPRARSIWMLRVFGDLSTREIATHPDVGCKPGHVDVIMQRTRRALADCMSRGGFDPDDLVPGTFVALWQAFRSEPSAGAGNNP